MKMPQNKSSSSSSSSNPTEVDLRYFLVVLTTCMVLAFSIGLSVEQSQTVVRNQVLQTEEEEESSPLSSVKRDPTVVRSFERNEESGEWQVLEESLLSSSSSSSSSSKAKSKGSEEEFNYSRKYNIIARKRTKYVADLGQLEHPNPDAEQYQPSGQHLLVDLKNVEEAFLDSEERLAQAMIDVVEEANLTLLSYHGHALDPAGVSMAGILLESHISLHTWPSEGIITLDLFTCGPNSLLPVVPVIERLFGVPRSESEKVVTKWSHDLRGFRSFAKRVNHHLENGSDLATMVMSPHPIKYKKEVRGLLYHI